MTYLECLLKCEDPKCYLVFSNIGESFAGGFLAGAIMDAVITAWCLVYFASLRKKARG